MNSKKTPNKQIQAKVTSRQGNPNKKYDRDSIIQENTYTKETTEWESPAWTSLWYKCNLWGEKIDWLAKNRLINVNNASSNNGAENKAKDKKSTKFVVLKRQYENIAPK